MISLIRFAQFPKNKTQSQLPWAALLFCLIASMKTSSSKFRIALATARHTIYTLILNLLDAKDVMMMIVNVIHSMIEMDLLENALSIAIKFLVYFLTKNSFKKLDAFLVDHSGRMKCTEI